MISSSAAFRPARWLAGALLLCALSFAAGVLVGAAQVSPPADQAPPVTTTVGP